MSGGLYFINLEKNTQIQPLHFEVTLFGVHFCKFFNPSDVNIFSQNFYCTCTKWSHLCHFIIIIISWANKHVTLVKWGTLYIVADLIWIFFYQLKEVNRQVYFTTLTLGFLTGIHEFPNQQLDVAVPHFLFRSCWGPTLAVSGTLSGLWPGICRH